MNIESDMHFLWKKSVSKTKEKEILKKKFMSYYIGR